MRAATTRKVLATAVAIGTFGFACSGVAAAADNGGTGGSGPARPGQVAGQDGTARHPRLRLLRGALRVSADAIGVPVKELVGGLRDGMTVEQFAQSKDVDGAKVEAALEEAANAAIDAALGRGAIGEQLAGALKARVPQRVDTFMTRSWPRLAGQSGPQAS